MLRFSKHLMTRKKEKCSDATHYYSVQRFKL